MSTVWYDYAIASAGTIAEVNTSSSSPATNSTIATESVCPKGWTLPDKTQIRTIGPDSASPTYVSRFLPVLGGHYYNSTLYNEDNRGFWWSSEAKNGAIRYFLVYKDGNLGISGYDGYRNRGLSIRCVQKS